MPGWTRIRIRIVTMIVMMAANTAKVTTD